MSLYEISVFIHVSAVVVGFGATFAEAIMFPVAMKAGVRHLPFVHQLQLAINQRMAGPALGLIILTGIYQTIDGDWGFGSFWISATFLIAIVLGGMQGAYFVPTDRRLAVQAQREIDETGNVSDDYQRQARREGIMGAIAGLLVIAAIFLMVTKPGSRDPSTSTAPADDGVEQPARDVAHERVADRASAGGGEVARRRAERGARERARGVLHLLDRDVALQRDPALLRGGVDRRADVAGVDRGDGDLAAVLEPQRVRVGGQAALAHAVRGAPREREVGEPGGDVDHAPARLAQRGERRGGHAPRAEQVDVDHRERVVVGRGAGRLREPEAGVVDQHVEPAEPLDRLGHRAVDVGLVAHVARDDVAALAAGRARPRGRRARAARRRSRCRCRRRRR